MQDGIAPRFEIDLCVIQRTRLQHVILSCHLEGATFFRKEAVGSASPSRATPDDDARNFGGNSQVIDRARFAGENTASDEVSSDTHHADAFIETSILVDDFT